MGIFSILDTPMVGILKLGNYGLNYQNQFFMYVVHFASEY